ncbi:hypothetical protein ACHAPT_002917 [Fusarium lateritium]
MDTNDEETNTNSTTNKSRPPDAASQGPPARGGSTARKSRKSRPPDDADAGSTSTNAEPANPPSTKAPKRPQKAPKTGSQQAPKGYGVNVKKFAEEMVRYRLDHWRARGKVVYTNGQQDATALWSPQWAGVAPPKRGGYNFFDGFDRTWFIPFDVATPLPQEKQYIADDLQRRGNEMKDIFVSRRDYLLPRIRDVLEEEIKTKCQDQWDLHWEKKDLPPMQWADVRHQYGLLQMVDLVARGRLADGRALLPGYYSIIVLDLAIDGKMIFQRVNMPLDVSLQGFMLRLESCSTSKNEDEGRLLELVRVKLQRIVHRSATTEAKKAQSLLDQLNKPFFKEGCQGSEMESWVFKLNHNANYNIRPAQGPANIRQWKGLKEETFGEFVQGVCAGKHPVVVRPWKIRLRRMWPEVDDLEEQLPPPATGEPELSLEQLEVVDGLLAKHTDQERQQGRRLMQALDRVRQPLDQFELMNTWYSDEAAFEGREEGGNE